MTAQPPACLPSDDPSPSITLHRSWLRRRGQGDPIVMVHGFGGDLNSWRVLAAAAALPRPVLAIDLPGHGRSPSGATSFPALVDAVATAIAEEGVVVADIVGHSLGAAIAVAVAAAASFRVRSLFLIAPAGLGPEINREFLVGFCQAQTEAELAASMSLLVANPDVIPPVFVHVTADTRAQPGIKHAQNAMAGALFPEGVQAFSVRDTLEGLTIPVLVVFGEADRIIPVRHMAGLRATIDRHVLPNIGHMPHIEARDTVANLLVDHLSNQN